MAAGLTRNDDQRLEVKEDRSTAANPSNENQKQTSADSGAFYALTMLPFMHIKTLFLARDASVIQPEGPDHNEEHGEGGDEAGRRR